MKLSRFEILMITAVSMVVTMFSIYNVNTNTWIWNQGDILQKSISLISGFSAFTGVVATVLFQKQGKKALMWAIVNALLFGTYAFIVNLTADALINLFWFIPLVVLNYFYFSKHKRHINHVNKRTYIILIIFALMVFIGLFFAIPELNKQISKVFSYTTAYGKAFKYYWVARVLDTLINTINVIAIIMMVRGLKGTWATWIVKNTLAIVFYSGIGFINVSVIIMNVAYTIISLYGMYKWRSDAKRRNYMKVIFVGQGAVGKSTIIKELKKLFAGKDLKVIDERKFLENNETWRKYFGDMKKYSGKMQLEFLDFWTKEMKKLEDSTHDFTIMDRHVIETYMFGDIHIKSGNFTDNEIEIWNRKVKKSKEILWNLNQVDYVINIEAPIEVIKERIDSRAKVESGRVTETNAPDDWWDLVNWGYYSEEYGFKKKYCDVAKGWVTYNNINSKETAKKIYKLMTAKKQ